MQSSVVLLLTIAAILLQTNTNAQLADATAEGVVYFQKQAEENLEKVEALVAAIGTGAYFIFGSARTYRVLL